MAETARHLPAIAALEAAIPDAAALVFACLGIALALHGRRALRARALNLAAVATSVFMNVLAAGPGWRNLAIWALPPVAYALASDTLSRPRLDPRPPSSPGGHPGRRRGHPAGHPRRPDPVAAAPGPGPRLHPGRVPRLGARAVPGRPGRRAPTLGLAPAPHPGKATKTARFMDLVTERHGPLAAIPLHRVAGISADLAPQLDLNVGAARTALRKAVLSARNEDPR